MKDTYRTVSAAARAELDVRGSRFVARVRHVETEADVHEALQEIRLIERHATHHVFAYRLLSGASRTLDDGEPVAGRPILRRLDAASLVDTVAIISRYYGGTKLGVGGLARAYAEAAAKAIEASDVETRVLRQLMQLVVGYADQSAAMRIIDRHGGRVVERNFGESVALRVAIRRTHTDLFRADLTDALRGRAAVCDLGSPAR